MTSVAGTHPRSRRGPPKTKRSDSRVRRGRLITSFFELDRGTSTIDARRETCTGRQTIDPNPRAIIDQTADEIIRQTLGEFSSKEARGPPLICYLDAHFGSTIDCFLVKLNHLDALEGRSLEIPLKVTYEGIIFLKIFVKIPLKVSYQGKGYLQILVKLTQPPTESISSVSFSPKANYLVATSWDNQVRCWEVLPTGNSVAKAMISHDQPVLCSTWKDDGTTVFSAGCDKQAKMWPLLSGGQPVTVAMHDAPIREIAWIPEMNLLVTGSWDKTLKYLLVERLSLIQSCLFYQSHIKNLVI
eukprot:Gb_30896 [translate_table: standard]